MRAVASQSLADVLRAERAMKHRLIAAASMSFLLVVPGMPSSSAAPTPPSGGGSSATAPEAEDIETAAQGLGVPRDVASAVLAGSGAFIAVVEDLRTRFPSDFADAAFASIDGKAAWVAFQSASPDGALDLIETLPFNVEIRTNFIISERERELASGSALGAFSDVVKPVTASASVEPGTTEIHIVYQGGMLPAVAELLDAAVVGAAEIAVRELDNSLTFTATYEELNQPVAEDEVLSGGTA